jgi:hypothetical protein
LSRKPEDTHADLAALADGTLPAARCEQLLAQVADSPDLAAELERQRRAVAIMRTLESVEAPSLLRRSIQTLTAGEAEPASARPPSAHRRRRTVPLRLQAGAAVALAAAAVVAVVLALTTGGSSAPTAAPTVLQASSSALRPSTQPPPAQSRHNPNLLAASAAGIAFPYWGDRFGWQTAGARTDTLAGRTVTTVFYTHRGAGRVWYSIVSGAALPVPVGGATIERHSVSFHVVRAANPTVVTWREAGHTCILTARAVDAGTLVRLATWERS